MEELLSSKQSGAGSNPAEGAIYSLIDDYMLLSRDERQKHLNLNTDCLEIGGDSREFRGLLAHFLKTTIPRKHIAHLCHACHNAKCSNLYHLYWGTPAENVADKISSPLFVSTHPNYEANKQKRMNRTRPRRISDEELLTIKSIIENEPNNHGRIHRLSLKLGVSHTQVNRYIKRLNSK